jgi:integrase
MIHWLDVTTTEDDDVRATRPSMKTEQSHRQIPISESLAALYDLYVADARAPDARHGFLLTARDGAPLSAESVNQMMRDLTEALQPIAVQRFRERTGGKRSVSPHDLRHTCATARYSMFMAVEPNRELTLQRMRAFFGWSLTSEMPELYARAAIQDDLLRSWKRLFDDRVRLLRNLDP